MRFLARCCDVVLPTAVTAGSKTGTAHRVCITIDDGHASALDIAAPILAELGLTAAFFIPTDGIGRRDRLSKADVRGLADRGFVIGSHGCSHRSLRSLPPDEIVREARESKQILEDVTGREVDAFAYPFGTRRDFDDVTEEALQRAGYRVAFTAQHGAVDAATHPLRVPRVKIEGRDSAATFAAVVAGGADPWRWVDRYLWWLQTGAHRRRAVISTTRLTNGR